MILLAEFFFEFYDLILLHLIIQYHSIVEANQIIDILLVGKEIGPKLTRVAIVFKAGGSAGFDGSSDQISCMYLKNSLRCSESTSWLFAHASGKKF